MRESYLVSLLVKLAAAASIASVLARAGRFKTGLMQEHRTLNQRLEMAVWLGIVFGGSVAVRVISKTYEGPDLGMEGSLLAGLIGGYVTGLTTGIVVSLPAMMAHERLSMLLFAGIGVLGGLVRDCAPAPEDIWRFSPYFDLNVYRFFKEIKNPRGTAFHLLLLASILFAELLRATLSSLYPSEVFSLTSHPNEMPAPFGLALAASYLATLFAVAIPLKIWYSARNEKKLEEQDRLLVEARLAALTSQINPHFLFNTLNSVSSLIRTDQHQARVMLLKLSQVLRRLLRKYEKCSPLREELSFIEDYLSIEIVRFGDKLRFEKDVSPDALDMMVPSMLLQPLVENSIRHGLSSKVEGGTIRICARRANDRLLLEIEDDGVGIPESKLAALLEGGIGVSNVNERLKVLFGKNYRMWIDSKPGEGTKISIDAPELQVSPLPAAKPPA